MNQELKEQALSFIDGLDGEAKEQMTLLLNELVPWVKETHSIPPTTKNYYGDYMRIMSYRPEFAKAIGVMLVAAGANPEGVRAAYNIVRMF
jgi:hypothetical protein